MEYSAEEDISLAISVIKLNATQDYHKKLIICQVYHVSWLNPATVSASFNILCKYYDLQIASKWSATRDSHDCLIIQMRMHLQLIRKDDIHTITHTII